jgi:hypothetical protein
MHPLHQVFYLAVFFFVCGLFEANDFGFGFRRRMGVGMSIMGVAGRIVDRRGMASAFVCSMIGV